MTASSDHRFALCLTHDVDKPFKTPLHAAYDTLLDRDLTHLIRDDSNPYWQFETIMDLEAQLDVRSAFYFLNEPPISLTKPGRVLDPESLSQTVGRYSVHEPAIAEVVRELAAGGWEVGLHGSYHTPRDRKRLQREKIRIEAQFDGSITGGRQHYLNLAVPETWSHYRELGLQYDASLGSRTESGFHFGYDPIRPFDDEFVVFPLTLMEQHLPDPGREFSEAWAVCESLLETAARESAVMTVLFHPRYFSEAEFPGYRTLYRQLVETALDMDAWVGPPETYYSRFLTDGESAAETRRQPVTANQ